MLLARRRVILLDVFTLTLRHRHLVRSGRHRRPSRWRLRGDGPVAAMMAVVARSAKAQDLNLVMIISLLIER